MRIEDTRALASSGSIRTDSARLYRPPSSRNTRDFTRHGPHNPLDEIRTILKYILAYLIIILMFSLMLLHFTPRIICYYMLILVQVRL